VIAALAVVAACKHRGPHRDWQYVLDGYVEGDRFADGWFRDDAIEIATDPYTVTALDPRTGEVLWTKTPARTVPHAEEARPTLVLEVPDGHETTLVEVSPRSGAVERTIVRRPALRAQRFAANLATVFAVTDDTLTAFDASTGAERWTDDSGPIHEILVTADRVVVARVDGVYRGLDVADGAERWRAAGTCCELSISPDGANVYLASGDHTIAHIARDHVVSAAVRGTVVAVSDRWAAISDVGGLRVVAHDGATVVELPADDAHDFYAAVAFHDDELVYFHDADTTLWQRHLPRGTPGAVQKVVPGVTFSTEHGLGDGVAYLGAPPRWAAGRMLVLDGSVLTAYRP
jgi:outer membrane protein assembly factor BamB